ncbi:hypothetical protein JT358_15730 [Micrococcales bacterium 31B]|nr:hypothetical protein [Micrococcales bacterium 31B]
MGRGADGALDASRVPSLCATLAFPRFLGTLADDRVVITPLGGGRTLELTWATNAPVTATLEEWRLEDDLLQRSWGDTLTRLTVILGATEGACRTTLTYAKGQR